MTRKIDPFTNFSGTVHSAKGPWLMLYNDSITTLSELEISIHTKVSDIEEVYTIARDLKTRNIRTFTIIEKYPNKHSDYFLVKFGQVSDEELLAISYYRVNSKSGQVDKIVE